MPSLNPRRSSTSLVNQADIKGPEKKDITTATNAVAVPATATFSTPVLLMAVHKVTLVLQELVEGLL